MKKIILTIMFPIFIFGSHLNLDNISFHALLDAENGMSLEELIEKYSEALEYFSRVNEYIFTFPKEVGRCKLDIEDVQIFGNADVSMKNMLADVTKESYLDLGFVVLVFLDKKLPDNAGIDIFFKYLWTKDGVSYNSNITLPLKEAMATQEVLNIPGECAVWDKIKITTKDTKWKNYFFQ